MYCYRQIRLERSRIDPFFVPSVHLNVLIDRHAIDCLFSESPHYLFTDSRFVVVRPTLPHAAKPQSAVCTWHGNWSITHTPKWHTKFRLTWGLKFSTCNQPAYLKNLISVHPSILQSLIVCYCIVMSRPLTPAAPYQKVQITRFAMLPISLEHSVSSASFIFQISHLYDHPFLSMSFHLFFNFHLFCCPFGGVRPPSWIISLNLSIGLLLVTCCLSNAIHCMGQNIKSLAACVCVCAHEFFGVEYLENA